MLNEWVGLILHSIAHLVNKRIICCYIVPVYNHMGLLPASTVLASSTGLRREKRRPANNCSRWCHFLLLSRIHVIRTLVRIWLRLAHAQAVDTRPIFSGHGDEATTVYACTEYHTVAVQELTTHHQDTVVIPLFRTLPSRDPSHCQCIPMPL